MALILLIAGAIASGFDGSIEDLRVQACTTPVEQYDGLTGEKWIGDQYAEIVDDVMCTSACPCETGSGDANKKLWDGYGEAYLNKYNRTTTTGSTSNSMVPLVFASGSTSVSNYKACYDNVMEAKYKTTEAKSSQSSSEQEQMKKVKEFFEKGGYDFLSQLEKDYECASMCKVPLFYLTRDVKDGKPEKECTEAIVEAVTGKVLVAVICFITGLVLLCACICSFPLCSGFKQPEKE